MRAIKDSKHDLPRQDVEVDTDRHRFVYLDYLGLLDTGLGHFGLNTSPKIRALLCAEHKHLVGRHSPEASTTAESC